MRNPTNAAPRFRGAAASPGAVNLAGALVVATLTAALLAGLFGPLVALAFFAVGAGAGYSLSGSV